MFLKLVLLVQISTYHWSHSKFQREIRLQEEWPSQLSNCRNMAHWKLQIHSAWFVVLLPWEVKTNCTGSVRQKLCNHTSWENSHRTSDENWQKFSSKNCKPNVHCSCTARNCIRPVSTGDSTVTISDQSWFVVLWICSFSFHGRSHEIKWCQKDKKEFKRVPGSKPKSCKILNPSKQLKTGFLVYIIFMGLGQSWILCYPLHC